MSNFYTVREVADVLNLTPDAVRRYIYTGKLEAKKFNGAYIIDRDAAEQFIKDRTPAITAAELERVQTDNVND